MQQIKERRDFHLELENEGNIYIPYAPYIEIPNCQDYRYGEKRTVVLRNAVTGELEKISFQLTGATPFFTRSGYRRYWGQMESQRSICIVYSFDSEGWLEGIFAAFCGGYPATSALRFMSGKFKEWGEMARTV